MDYEAWHNKIDATLQWRQKYWNGDKAWKRFLALYRGDHWRTSRYNEGFLDPDSDVPRDRITVNFTGSTIQLAKSFLIKGSPKFVIKPRPALNAQDVQKAVVSAMLQQEVLNYEYEQQEMHPQLKSAILDSIIIGHGITKTGFTTKKPIAKDKKVGQLDTKEYIQDETAYVERINPFRFLFDVENECFNQLDNVGWCAEIFFRNITDVINDDTYNKKIRGQLKRGEEKADTYQSVLYQPSEYSYNKGDNTETDLAVCYEVWDKKRNKYYVFLSGVIEPLIETEWPYDYLDGFPYEKTDFIPVPNEHYGLGIPAWIEDQQLELNRVRTSMYDHRRRFNRKYLVQEGALEPGEKQKLISGDTGTIIMTTGGPNSVAPLQELKIPSDAFGVESTIKADIMELTGVDQLARGGQLPGRTSAAEINARQSYVNLKLDDRVESVDKFVLKNGKKVLQHIKTNTKVDRVMQIAGPLGQTWIRFSPEDIRSEFDITMDTVSAPKIDEVADRQQALQIFQLIMSNMQTIMQLKIPINFQELFAWLFGKFGEKDISRFFSGAVPTIDQIQGGGNLNGQLGNQTLGTLNGEPPPVMDANQLRNQVSGNLSGGGFNVAPQQGGLQ